MIDDREIWACALAVEQRYRHNATRHVGERITVLARAGDVAGTAVWQRIAHALDRL